MLRRYNFKEIEHKYNYLWESSKTYKWDRRGNNNFVIDTPPPTVSGELHIGHIFSYCHTDFIARFQRMLGKNVFYPIGFDDNGLPTERLVEKAYNVCAKEVGREKFTEMCYTVIGNSKQKFTELFKAVGISYDWSLEYHTISGDAITLSQMSFIDLYNKGYIYRKMQPILWDPVDKTAIAQAEIEDKDFESSLNTIVFFTEENEPIHIATTRPELLPACVAVLCHPDDKRYSHLINNIRKAIVPITQERVPIIADERVKIDKGTGLVMCCTFGDELDVYWQQKHKLPIKIIINKDGKINLSNGKEIFNIINGQKASVARKKIIEVLISQNLLVDSIAIIHSVKCAERSGAPLEILPTYQWFVKVLDQKEQILKKVRECNWHPECMRKRMEIWIDGLNWDWCISRQRYFGVPFPVWYSKRKGEEGKVILPAISELPVNPLSYVPIGYSQEEIIADQDVMDTWATSAITPQLNLRAINKELCLENNLIDSKIFPADLRGQSHEIIRTWAFYTILKAQYHEELLPWKNIMISGWCLADDKKKMSKSKGNIVTPQSILDMYGADVVRYWAANSRLGVDTIFSENVFKIGKRLVTKLWNASKFASLFIEKGQEINLELINETIDKWVLSKLYKVVERVKTCLLHFKYCEALEAVEEFFWKDFCDNYLELVKKRAYRAEISAKQSLAYTLSIILRLFAPFLPYITEEIYNQLYDNHSIHSSGNWPDVSIYDQSSEQEGDDCVQILSIVRKFKASNNLSIKSCIKKLVIKTNNRLNKSIENDLQAVCNAETIEWGDCVDKNEKYIVDIID